MNDLRIFERDGKALVNSRDVARIFSKRHDNVIADIDRIIGSPGFSGDRSWFREKPWIHEQNGQTYRSFDISRQGFVILAMGYTGLKAMEFKVRYIQEFDRMEAELSNRQMGGNAELVQRIATLEAIIATLAQGRPQIGISYVTIRQLLDEAGCRVKGRDKINRRVGYWLGQVTPKDERLRSQDKGPWWYPRAKAEKFMRDIGTAWVKSHNAGMRPTEVDLRQGVLSFTQPEK